MPELPEVETLKRELSRVLVGKKFKDSGKKIIGVERRAKVLIWRLSGNAAMLIHLKMTGQLVFVPRGLSLGGVKESPQTVVGGHPQDPTQHTRRIFYFTDGSRLLFNDLRKFGWIKTVPENELARIFKNTGVEPLSAEFTVARFKDLLKRFPKRRIKPFLLDQNLVAGLGNIYVDESCFLAGVKPTRTVKSLTFNNIAQLHAAIGAVLKLAIRKKGTSARNYVRADGRPGGFVPYLKVYGRAGQKCKRCQAGVITKIKLNGRGTHFCPKCQR